MTEIKVAELFYSIQGEGRYMGVPSVFLRTFGCNFKCAGFGMPSGEASTERNVIAINAENYTSYNQLPLVSTGCDSYASWDHRFKHLSPFIGVDELAGNILALLPKKAWQQEHLVITGGEPLLGWQRAYPDLLTQPGMLALRELTFETNGTQPLHQDFRYFLLDWTLNPRGTLGGSRGPDALTFSVSPKLSCSGEDQSIAINPEVVAEYQSVGHTYLKFVVATEQDVEEALAATKKYQAAGFRGPVYLMPVGGVESVYAMNNRTVADLAMRHGLRYSDRLQVPLFKNAWGT